MLLSDYLDYIKDRPGMYIGKETSRTLETFILGFNAAHPDIPYHEHINVRKGKGPKGISSLDSFQDAFAAAQEGALSAEKEAGVL